jgi:hypothetical protein
VRLAEAPRGIGLVARQELGVLAQRRQPAQQRREVLLGQLGAVAGSEAPSHGPLNTALMSDGTVTCDAFLR